MNAIDPNLPEPDNAPEPHSAIDMTHGGGGRAMAELIRTVFHRHLANSHLAQGNDGAVLELPPGRVVMSTDGHVISPLASSSKRALRSPIWSASFSRWRGPRAMPASPS